MNWALLLLNLCLASLNVWAVITVRSTYRALRLRLAERSTRSVTQLDAVVSSHESALQSLSTTVRRLSSRVGMQDLRARRKGESEQLPTDPAERKAELRKRLRQGELRVIHDSGRSADGHQTTSGSGTN